LKFKAAVLRQSKHPLSIEYVEFRDKLSAGQVLVRIQRTAICGSQIGEIDAVKGPDKYLPHLLGHEAIAQVVDSGDSNKCTDGDQVILHWIKCEGIDAPPPRYFSNSERVNAGQITTFSEYAVVSENRLTVIDNCKSESLNSYSIIGCSLLTTYGTLTHVVGSKRLGKALVLGGGGIGQATIFLLKHFYESDITLVEPNITKSRYCHEIGASTSLTDISQIDQETLFDSAIETTGVPEVIERSYEVLNRTGILALVGVTEVGLKVTIDPTPLHYGKEIVGIYGGNAKPKKEIHLLTKALSSSELTKKLQFKEFSLDQADAAIQELRSGSFAGRVILNCET
jgi:S-(hydroxymethyl)glutathione dehydrogenase/alcohol dehydrogenase